MFEAGARETRKMSSPRERSFELAALMDLRLAFGPGTRLWALRSREDLCYDWLRFKANQANASFREFALQLYVHEKANALESMNTCDIRKRIAAVFRTYQIKKRRRPDPPFPVKNRTQPAQMKVNGMHRSALPPTGIHIPSISIQGTHTPLLGRTVNQNQADGPRK